jgi:hypothetical protein
VKDDPDTNVRGKEMSSEVNVSAAFLFVCWHFCEEFECLIDYETFKILDGKRFIFPLDNYYSCILVLKWDLGLDMQLPESFTRRDIKSSWNRSSDLAKAKQ